MLTVQLTENKSVELAGGAYAPLVWHRLFPGDLYKEIAEMEKGLLAKPATVDTYSVMCITYTFATVADTAAGRQTPPFDEWALGMGEINLFALAVSCIQVAKETLFRSITPPHEDQEKEEKTADIAAADSSSSPRRGKKNGA